MTNFFFDLNVHRRVWRRLIMPLLEGLTWYLLLPRTVGHTLLWLCIPMDYIWLRAVLVTYSYHMMLVWRLWLISVPAARSWLTTTRQRIFDSKYLLSTELQNYHDSREVTA